MTIKLFSFSLLLDHYPDRSQAAPLLRVAAAVVGPEGVRGAGPGVPARRADNPRQGAGGGGPHPHPRPRRPHLHARQAAHRQQDHVHRRRIPARGLVLLPLQGDIR